MTADIALLRRYADAKSEDAFAELVQRHLNLVYSAALRQVNGDAHLAQEVVQTVFTDLAQKAATLRRRETLVGWLYTSTQFAAAKAVRGECRRRAHEQQAQAMQELLQVPAPEPDWDKLRPALDEVMHELNGSDREMLLLRYFENRRLGEIGKALGLSEDAARKRIERALDRLRSFLLKRGITTASTALATVLSVNAVQTAPAALGATITSAALGSAAVATSASINLLHLMTISKTKLAIVALTAACLVIPIAVQHRTQVKLREKIGSLRRQLDSRSGTQVPDEPRSTGTEQASATLDQDQLRELLRLRGEVGMLRGQTNELQQENSRLRADTGATQAAGDLLSHKFVPLGGLTFAGYTTPEAALESVLWAERETNINAYLTSLLPETQPAEQKRLQMEFDRGISQPFFHDGNFVTGFQILETNPVSEDEIALTFFIGGHGGTMKLVAKRIGDEWKLHAGPTF